MKKKICYILVFLLTLCPIAMLFGCNENKTQYNITVEVWYANYGTVYGTGAYDENSTVEITAQPKDNYSFVAWMRNNIVVSYDANYRFEVTKESAGTYVAIFTCPDLELVTLTDVELVRTYDEGVVDIQSLQLNVWIGQTYDTMTYIFSENVGTNEFFEIANYTTALNYRETITARIDLVYSLLIHSDEDEEGKLIVTTKTTYININLDKDTLSTQEYELEILDSLKENEGNKATIKFNFIKLQNPNEESLEE